MDLSKAKTTYEMYDEIYVDPPDGIVSEREQRAHAAVRELLGLCAGLMAAVEAAIASRPVVTIVSGKDQL